MKAHVYRRISRLALLMVAMVAMLAVMAGISLWTPVVPGAIMTPPKIAHFVGAQACAQCHQHEVDAWQGSHHELAMQVASPTSVLAPFKGERLTEDGITSVFTQRDGHYFVETEGQNGHLQKFEVAYTFGVSPLQQYIIPMPAGAMQALTIAWDSRPRERGGQRWFHLQAGQHIHVGDELHWTGRQNNWNFMCAECHVTQFKKNYNADTRSYNSSWSALNVGCEACHGPGSNHVAWASLSESLRSKDANKGLSLLLDERKTIKWIIQPDSGNARPGGVVSSSHKEVEMCARCHAHRSQISDDYHPEQPLLDTHIPSLLGHDLFWGDGQMKKEVYNYASFQQSKMYQKGVTCSDCHDPHSQQLRLPGNQTCLQCHASSKYESVDHYFHPTGSPGASCAGCHMPTTTYMSIDPRHDHGIRVPRPDLSLLTGAPNACNQCHTDKSVQWAADLARRWYPHLSQRQPPLAATLRSGEKLDRRALSWLFDVMTDQRQASVVRATALSRVPVGQGATEIKLLLNDRDPLVRLTAVDALSVVPDQLRSIWLRPMLGDTVKAVRIAAARWLVGVPTADWADTDRIALEQAAKEYVAVQIFNADRPEAYNNLGTFYADQGDWRNAESALKTAINMDPDMDVSFLNLADLYRAQGEEGKAQSVLQQVLHRHPENALAQHALGLSLIRQKRTVDALKYLRQATLLAPSNAHFSYVYILALEDASNHAAAKANWARAIKMHPDDQELLSIYPNRAGIDF